MSSFDEFVQDINNVANEFPFEAEKQLVKITNKFKKIVREKSPDSGKATKRKLKKSWKSEIKGASGQELQANIWSTSPHFHLVDRGHVLKDAHGNIKGFVQGKHFLAATVQEVERDVLPEEMEKFFKKIKKKIEK